MSGPYEDILHLPHHVSATRPQMPRINRAAQFSPFAALAGYDDAIQETARRTDARIALDENVIAALDRKLRMLAEMAAAHPEASITYFRPDEKKEGGAYVTITGAIKRIDNDRKAIVLMDGESVAMEDILEIACEMFQAF